MKLDYLSERPVCMHECSQIHFAYLCKFISHLAIDGVQYDSRKAGDLSTFFDVGGIIGKFKVSFQLHAWTDGE